jgi:acetyl esterase/lipase
VGYLVSVLGPAIATALALRPRPTRGPRATPSFVVASAANELPFVIVYWLVAVTALAAADGDISSPVGWAALTIAVCTATGLAVVIGRATRDRAVLTRAVTAALGQDRRSAHHTMGRVLAAPLRLPARAVRRERDLTYGPAGRENQLDVYRHRSRPLGCPVLVYFHPGGFFSGGKSRQSRALFDRLVEGGWVCVSANYRLGGAGEFPNNLVDAKRVIAWIRAHAADFGADPSTLIVCGGSAGAHLAAMCALTANEPMLQPGFEVVDTSVSAAVGLYGYYGSAPAPECMRSAPAAHLRTDAPPCFVIHGTLDPMVAAADARQFVEQLRATSREPVLYAELPGGQHNFDQFPSLRCFAVVDAVEAFGTWVHSEQSR